MRIGIFACLFLVLIFSIILTQPSFAVERFSEDAVPEKAKHIVFGDVSVKSLAEELRHLYKTKRLDAVIRSLR